MSVFNPIVTLDGMLSGYEYKSEILHILFGSRNSTLQDLQFNYPDYSFREVHQVHGEKIVPASEQKIEADGHYTSQVNEALLIKTADCMPIVLFDSENIKICAVHAGWRGVANKITVKALDAVFKGSDIKNIQVFVGPHIRQKNFEVEQDVLEQLVEGTKKPHLYYTQEGSKFKVSLLKILEAQLFAKGILQKNLFTAPDCTFESLNFNSFRRQKQSELRNYSLAVLI